MKLNIREYDNHQTLIFPPCIGDYLPWEHLAWIVDEVIEKLDLSCLFNKISSEGNPSYHPGMMLKVLFYGYATKVFSSRKIATKLESDIAFIFLAGMQKPNFRTISDFRKNNIEEIKELFVQIVQLCQRVGMVKLGHISLDSTVIKANAAYDERYTEKKLIKERKEIEKTIEEYLKKANKIDENEDKEYGEEKRGDELPKEISSKERRLKKLEETLMQLKKEKGEIRTSKGKKEKEINITDIDAKYQRDKGKITTGYRSHIIVDEKKQVIIACNVTNEQADNNQLMPMVDELEKNIGIERVKEKPKLSADSGYSSGKNYKEIEKKNIDGYIPDSKWQGKKRRKENQEDSKFQKEKFTYNSDKDVYKCPSGKELKYAWKENGRGVRKYLYKCDSSRSCKYFGKCTSSKEGRTIKRYENEDYIEIMRKKLKSKEGKEIYERRKRIVEPVIGNIKQNLGFREFLLRGVKKVRGEFAIVAAVHNIKKIGKYMEERYKELMQSSAITEMGLGLMTIKSG